MGVENIAELEVLFRFAFAKGNAVASSASETSNMRSKKVHLKRRFLPPEMALIGSDLDAIMMRQ